jgi:hypothetical protein
MDRSIDVGELWRIAARKVQASPLPPHDLHVEGLRCLASALASEGRYDAKDADQCRIVLLPSPRWLRLCE